MRQVVAEDGPRPTRELMPTPTGANHDCSRRPCHPFHSEHALGAWLGHEAGDSKGQQRYPADSCAPALTSGGSSEQRRSPEHTVHGMQGVRGSNPLSSTRHNASAARPLRAVCQRFARVSLLASGGTLYALTGLAALSPPAASCREEFLYGSSRPALRAAACGGLPRPAASTDVA
jgi:hypothetical protein